MIRRLDFFKKKNTLRSGAFPSITQLTRKANVLKTNNSRAVDQHFLGYENNEANKQEKNFYIKTYDTFLMIKDCKYLRYQVYLINIKSRMW